VHWGTTSALGFAAVSDAIFSADGERVHASELARGPWDPTAQHGGAPAALIVRALERLEPDPGLTLARLTLELLRPVPLGELSVRAKIVRPGKRVQLLEASLYAPGEVEVVRARALRIRRAEVEAGADDEPVPAPPEDGGENDFARGGGPMFATDAMEIRFVEGSFYGTGPATAWFRLRYELVAGEAPSPLQRLAAAADFPNGISSSLPWDQYLFINPDLTIYIEREPVGEWICLKASTRVRPGGSGFAEAVLFDRRGRVGRSLQALLVIPRP
jgi:hypothetical protein